MTCIAQWSHWVLCMQAPRIHNKKKRISRYLPYIEQKLIIIRDTTQEVQKNTLWHTVFGKHRRLYATTMTQKYISLYATTMTHTYISQHRNHDHTKTYNTAHAMICKHRRLYAATMTHKFIIYHRNHDTHKDVYYCTCYDMPSNKYNVRLQYTYKETHTVWNTKTYAHTSIAQWSHWVIYMRAPRLYNKIKESPNTCPAESQYIA